MNSYSASEFVLIDFTSSPSPATWQIVNDDVMGGISTSRFQATTNGAGLFQGEVSLENNGGFASVRLRPSARDVTRHDALSCGSVATAGAIGSSCGQMRASTA